MKIETVLLGLSEVSRGVSYVQWSRPVILHAVSAPARGQQVCVKLFCGLLLRRSH